MGSSFFLQREKDDFLKSLLEFRLPSPSSRAG
jgi:hypothetical protein